MSEAKDGLSRICQQIFIDTYYEVEQVKLYDRKNKSVATEILNDKMMSRYASGRSASCRKF